MRNLNVWMRDMYIRNAETGTMQDWDAYEVVGLLHEYSRDIVDIIAEFFPKYLGLIIAGYSYDDPKIVHEISHMHRRLRFGNVELCREIVQSPNMLPRITMKLKLYGTGERGRPWEIITSGKKAWRALFWQPIPFNLDHPHIFVEWFDGWTNDINKIKSTLYSGMKDAGSSNFA